MSRNAALSLCRTIFSVAAGLTVTGWAPPASAQNGITTLHSFTAEASNPRRVAIASDGTIYVPMTNGGLLGGGTVYKLAPNGSGGYTISTLASFGASADGRQPS